VAIIKLHSHSQSICSPQSSILKSGIVPGFSKLVSHHQDEVWSLNDLDSGCHSYHDKYKTLLLDFTIFEREKRKKVILNLLLYDYMQALII